ncbi:MAG: NAD(P)H-dependent oxidoreductase [SAR202 cluster bacterium]|nr:NAD(P)H-dependent oxidoreductase [SAR202 cluster bacterium]
MTSSSPGKLKVLGISGSLRQKSFNSALLREAQALAPDAMEIVIFDIHTIPLYDGDVEAAGDPAPVRELKDAIRAADGVLWVTPEYNHSTSGVLKNTIDWASRGKDSPLVGKPVTFMGAGSSGGTARAQMHLENIFAETRSHSMSKPGVLVAFARRQFDDNLTLNNDDTKMAVRAHLEAFALWIQKINRK